MRDALDEMPRAEFATAWISLAEQFNIADDGTREIPRPISRSSRSKPDQQATLQDARAPQRETGPEPQGQDSAGTDTPAREPVRDQVSGQQPGVHPTASLQTAPCNSRPSNKARGAFAA